MTDIFFNQTVLPREGGDGFIKHLLEWMKKQTPERVDGYREEFGAIVKHGGGVNDSHSDFVYESLSESASNIFFDPIANLIFVKKDQKFFSEVSERISSKIFSYCQLGDSISLVVFEKIAVLNWRVTMQDLGQCSIFQRSRESVEAELSQIGGMLVKCLSDSFAMENKNLSRGQGANTKYPPTALWTSRTLLISESSINNQNSSWVDNWVEDSEGISKVVSPDAIFLCGWGNNLIRFNKTASPIDEFIAVSNGMQYLYASLHEANNLVTGCLKKLKSHEVDKKVKQSMKEVGSNFFLLEYTLLETEYSLQGLQRKLLLSFLSAWRIKDLIQNVSYKIQRIKLMVDDAITERYSNGQRWIRAILFVIGTIEVVGAAVEVIHLSHSPEVAEKPTFGVLRLIHAVNPDLLITLLLALLFVLAGFAVWWGVVREEKE